MNTALALPDKITLRLPANMPQCEWAALGKLLRQSETKLQWLIGDWINFGARTYGKRKAYALAKHATGYDSVTLYQYARVAERFESDNRVSDLTWRHHRAVETKPPKARAQYLKKAVSRKLSARELEAEVQRDTRRVLAALPVPQGTYRVIYADPPWDYGHTGGNLAFSISGARHYQTMSTEDICAMRLPAVADNAVLFLWATAPLLPEAFKVIGAWGFEYKAQFVWDKVKHVMGRYNSVRHELLLVATRGNCMPDVSVQVDSVQSIESKEHSQKPEEFRAIIDKLYAKGPRVELFARGTLPAGWVGWGNEYEAVETELAA